MAKKQKPETSVEGGSADAEAHKAHLIEIMRVAIMRGKIRAAQEAAKRKPYVGEITLGLVTPSRS